MNMNTLTYFPYVKRYYLTHPWEFFQQCWYNLRHAWKRATKGYCDLDACETYSFLLELIPSLLDEIREADVGYPAHMTHEQWQSILKEMSKLFRDAIEIDDFDTPLASECDKPREERDPKIMDAYWKEVEAKYEARRASLSKGMKMLEEHFWDLWI